MTSAPIGNTSKAPPSNPSRTANPPQASQQDVRAMSDAFAAARDRMKGENGVKLPLQGDKSDLLGKSELSGKAGKSEAPAKGGKGGAAELAAKGGAEEQAAASAPDPRRDPLVAEREAARDSGHADGATLAQATVPPAPPVVVAGAMPAPHVDPSAFAQLMTQLWAREASKGTKEIRVEFGDSTWPATGATLVRNAAGALDIEVFMAGGTDGDQGSAERLRQAFGDAGVAVGALALTNA